MYETVKTVNGYPIQRMKGTHSFYHLKLDNKKEMTFRTQKAAAEMARKLPQKGK